MIEMRCILEVNARAFLITAFVKCSHKIHTACAQRIERLIGVFIQQRWSSSYRRYYAGERTKSCMELRCRACLILFLA